MRGPCALGSLLPWSRLGGPPWGKERPWAHSRVQWASCWGLCSPRGTAVRQPLEETCLPSRRGRSTAGPPLSPGPQQFCGCRVWSSHPACSFSTRFPDALSRVALPLPMSLRAAVFFTHLVLSPGLSPSLLPFCYSSNSLGREHVGSSDLQSSCLWPQCVCGSCVVILGLRTM